MRTIRRDMTTTTLTEIINENHHFVKIQGTQEEMSEYIQCLDKYLTNGKNQEEIKKLLEKTSTECQKKPDLKHDFNEINLGNRRIYIFPNKVLFPTIHYKSEYLEILEIIKETNKIYLQKGNGHKIKEKIQTYDPVDNLEKYCEKLTNGQK